MYTKEYNEEAKLEGDFEGHWEILDPDGDILCYVTSEAGADALLTHLNRES